MTPSFQRISWSCGPEDALSTAESRAPAISIVIPFRDSPQLPHLRPRLEALSRDLAGVPETEVVIVEATTQTTRHYSEWNLGGSGISHLTYTMGDAHFSLATARNMGAQHARGQFLTFVDVDLRFAPSFWQQLLHCTRKWGLGTQKQRYVSIPCIYLTEAATDAFLKECKSTRVDKCIQRWFDGDSSGIELVAPCTSCIVINRLRFLGTGGYREDFTGHGFEDFELHHRLLADMHLERPDDYYTDTETWTSNQTKGFRALFASTGQRALSERLFAIHLWHIRPDNSPFYATKASNGTRLRRVMEEFDKGVPSPVPLTAREARDQTFAYVGIRHSDAANTLRDAFPLLGSPLFIDPDDFLTDRHFDASAFEQTMSFNGVERVLFPNPYRTPGRLAMYQWCRSAGFPYLVFERGSLPDSWFFDDRGFNADSSGYAKSNWDRPLEREAMRRVQDYIAWCIRGSTTLEPQGARIGAHALRSQLEIGRQRVIFVPFQRPSDTVTVHFAGAAVSVGHFAAFIDRCAERLRSEGWIILCKRHPYETEDVPLTYARYVPPATNVIDLVDLSDSVALMNSSVGLYAMMLRKPCYIFADSFYSFPDVNRAITSLEVDTACSEMTRTITINNDTVYRFIAYLTQHFYSFGPAKYRSWAADDGGIRKAATYIDFREIRIPAVATRAYT